MHGAACTSDRQAFPPAWGRSVDAAPRGCTIVGVTAVKPWRWVVRVGLGVLSALHLWWGAWAIVNPRGFFDTFPGFGRRWTAAYPPFNEHLVSDLGAIFVTLGVLLGLAAIVDDGKVTAVVLAGAVTFGALHLAFHVTHHGTLTGADLSLSLASLVPGVLAPIALLVTDRLVRRRARDAGAAAPP